MSHPVSPAKPNIDARNKERKYSAKSKDSAST
nr:MAG TPA: hypothetical protein [Caudoviricetes sp.]